MEPGMAPSRNSRGMSVIPEQTHAGLTPSHSDLAGPRVVVVPKREAQGEAFSRPPGAAWQGADSDQKPLGVGPPRGTSRAEGQDS